MKTILFAAPLKSRSGYGDRARDVAQALIELEGEDYAVSFISFSWGGTPDSNTPENVKERLMEFEEFKQLQAGGFVPDIFIHCTIPNEFQRGGKFNIGLTAGIETTACRPEWLEGCNRMDLVLTSSNHSKKVFELTKYPARNDKTGEQFGLQTPVQVLIEGYDPSVFRKLTLKSQTNESFYEFIEDNVRTDFNFLFVGHWLQGALHHDRKDVGGLIETFIETFGKVKNPPGLILKVGLAGFSRLEKVEIDKRISDIKSMMIRNGYKGKFPPIYVLNSELTGNEMNTLYNHKKVKAMVSFTKGEGFGRPLLEFTTTGKPVIASNWSGQIDFLNPDHSFLLPGEVHPVHPSAQNEWIINSSQWFNVNYRYASNLMKNIWKNYENFHERSRKHIKHSSNFSFQIMKENLLEILENKEELSGKAKEEKLVLPEIKLPELPKKETANEPA